MVCSFYDLSRLSHDYLEPGQNIWNKIEKSSKIRQGNNCLISISVCFLIAIDKVSFIYTSELYMSDQILVKFSLFSNVFCPSF